SSLTLGGFGGSPSRQEQFPVQDILKDDKDGVEMLTKAFRDLKGSPAMNVHSARQIVDGLLNNIVKNKNLLPILTSMRAYNEDMFDHGVNVSVLTLLQAEILGIEEKYLVDVGMAALLHDVGHLSDEGDDHADTKMGPEMTRDEMIKQRKRDVDGAKILLDSEGIPKLAAVVAFEKNMRVDMKGLPRKIYGKQLNLVSMMIAISDYYDKMRKRPEFYEEGGPEKAYEEMNAMSGTYFQPDLLKNFFSVVGIYPAGTLVELDTREIALVIQGNVMDIKRPQVEILYNADGKKYDTPVIANLIERDNRGQFRRSIVKSISMSEHFRDSGTNDSR
ncbi:HD domain-containing protein, partial [bacterium]